MNKQVLNSKTWNVFVFGGYKKESALHRVQGGQNMADVMVAAGFEPKTADYIKSSKRNSNFILITNQNLLRLQTTCINTGRRREHFTAEHNVEQDNQTGISSV